MSSGAASDDRDPLEKARELFVYAPLGIASRLSKDFPELVAEGKARYGVAKVVGTFAAKQGRAQFEERLRNAASAFCAPGGTAPPSSSTTEARDTSSTVRSSVDDVASDVSASASSATVGDEATPSSPSESAHLAIARYDTLSATQILSHLSALSAEQRGDVAAYERTTRNRRTILHRIAQLNGDAV